MRPVEVQVAIVDVIGPSVTVAPGGAADETVLTSETTYEQSHRVKATPQQEIASVTGSLLDLRSVYESNLRTLTSMHRMLETLRRGESASGVADLLLGEMMRQLHELVESTSTVYERLRMTSVQLDEMRGTAGV